MVASFLINRSDPLVAPFGGDRVPLTDLLKAIWREQAQSCSQCRPQEEQKIAQLANRD
jgi:hypothetical protein